MRSLVFAAAVSGVAGKLYCPTADDLTIAYCDPGPSKDKPCPSLTDGGWTIEGGGGAASKSAFNLLGGYVEYDIDLSNVQTGVNANIYTISPASFSESHFNKTLDYCDGAASGSDWCMELDWIEANGHCGGATTIHTIEGGGNDGCTAWGCRVSEHYSNSKFHMRIEHDANGVWTVTRDGEVLSGFNPAPDSRAWDYIKQMQEERGSVIYSSEWVGWVPVDDCGGGGDLYSSSFSISNLVISGSVVQGPEPNECGTPSPSPPAPTPTPTPTPPAPTPTPTPPAPTPTPPPPPPTPTPTPPGDGTCCWGGSSCDTVSDCHVDPYCGASESQCTGNCAGLWCIKADVLV